MFETRSVCVSALSNWLDFLSLYRLPCIYLCVCVVDGVEVVVSSDWKVIKRWMDLNLSPYSHRRLTEHDS